MFPTSVPELGMRLATWCRREALALAVTPRGTRAVITALDGSVELVDLSSGVHLADLRGHTGAASAVATTPDGLHAVTGGDDGSVRLWAVASPPHQVAVMAGPDGVASLAVTPDGRSVLAGGDDGTVVVLDLVTHEVIGALLGHGRGPVWSISCAADGRVATAGDDRTVRIWDLATRRERAVLTGHQDLAGEVSLTADGTLAVSVGDDETVRIWDVEEGREVGQIPVAEVATTAVVSPGGHEIVVGDRSGGVRVWDVAGRAWVAGSAGVSSPVEFLALTADGARIVVVHRNRALRVHSREREILEVAAVESGEDDDGVIDTDPVDILVSPTDEVVLVDDDTEWSDYRP